MVILEVYISAIPATLPPITQVTMVECFIYLLLLVLFMNFFMETKKVIVVVMV